MTAAKWVLVPASVDWKRVAALARIALEDCRQYRLKCGHTDIGTGRDRLLGLWDDEAELFDALGAASPPPPDVVGVLERLIHVTDEALAKWALYAEADDRELALEQGAEARKYLESLDIVHAARDLLDQLRGDG